MPKLGGMIADDEESYQYLAESIRKHPDQETLKSMVLDSGFGFCEYHNLSGGIVALHKGIKV
jgi:demethylmenaquinone methyltransferase/2-methoxy-6-polyprenyl-1,4-benzoquinol methylase